MAKWAWIERKFQFDYPVTKFPDIVERVRGTPARLEDRVADLPVNVLTRRDGDRWSIQENVGHLVDLGYLALHRVEQILAGESMLIAAEMTNRMTNQANHNAKNIGTLLLAFREERGKLVTRLEGLREADWGKAGLHPRLQQPMRVVDIACFDAEHDDYHLARISELIRALT